MIVRSVNITLILMLIWGVAGYSFSAAKNSVYFGGEYQYNRDIFQTYGKIFEIDTLYADIRQYTGQTPGGYHTGNFYIGIETKDSGAWVALLNTFTFGSVPGFTGSYKYNSQLSYADFQYLQLTYEIGMRTFLGLQTLFFDFGLRLGVQFNIGEGFTSDDPVIHDYLRMIPGKADILPALHVTFGLGVQIPLTHWLSLQAVFRTAIGVGLFNSTEMGVRIGLSFNNFW